MAKKYIIEARETAGGALKFDCPQPEVKTYTHNGIFDLYWSMSGNKANSVTQEEAMAFFNARNWFVREKTW